MLERRFAREFLKTAEGIRFGTLEVETPEGTVHRFGGHAPGPQSHLVIRDWRMVAALAAKGDIGLTEAYRDGWCDTPDLESLLRMALMNEDVLDSYIYGGWLNALAARTVYFLNRNTRAGSRRNIQAHYDLGNDFYRLWLDPSMTYSSALYGPGDDLTAAQQRKYDRIIDNLDGASGRLLEIGCGWGGFAERALARGDFAPKGLTLSSEQADYARARLGSGAQIALQDYRDED